MRIMAVLIGLTCLGLAWMPQAQAAEDPTWQTVQQNMAVAYQPPQASAEALLSLPSVYVLPGSFLYWFKHTYEELRLALTADPQQRSALLLQFSQHRLAESYQAMQHGNWSASVQALQEYQRDQQSLSEILASLQTNHTQIDDLLGTLKTQLGIQQALGEWVKKQAPAGQQQTVGALLQVRSQQTLALAVAENGALLGAQDDRPAPSATISASPSATVQSSPTAVPSP
jgi:hypothetical protein